MDGSLLKISRPPMPEVCERAPAVERINVAEKAKSAPSPINDWDAVTQVIIKQAPLLISHGRYQTLEGRLRRVPRPILAETPWLLYWRGMCLMHNDPVRGRADLEEAFALFKWKQDVAGIFLSWAGIVDACVAARKDYALLATWVAVLDDLMRIHPAFPSREVEASITAAVLRALTLHQPHHRDIGKWEMGALWLLSCGLGVDYQVVLGSRLVRYYVCKGEFSKANHIIEAMKHDVEKAPVAIQAEWLASEAAFGWFANEPQACSQAVNQGLEVMRITGMHGMDFDLYTQGVCGALSTGSLEAANAFLGNMGAILESDRRLDVSTHSFLLAWQSLCRGEFRLAVEQGQAALASAIEADASFQRALCLSVLAQALFEYGGRREAFVHIKELHDLARGMNSGWLEYLALILEAMFLCIQQRDGRAVVLLRKAFALSKAQGYMFIPGWRPYMVAVLCKKALDNGIEVEYVRDIIRQHGLRPPSPPLECEHWPWPVKIYTLGRFAVLREGKTLHARGAAQGKPLTLLKALIAFGGRDVNEIQLIDALWPDAEGDAAHQAFRITLHRLRQFLGDEKTVIVRDGSITLDASRCWVDAWAFERLTGKAQDMDLTSHAEKFLDLYQGHFLAKESEGSWTLPLRERLRSKFLRQVEQLGRRFEHSGAWEQAITCYRKGLETDPLAELLYQRLIACYQQQGRRVEALGVYQRCRTMFSALLGVEPSPATTCLAK
ncbi:MAG: AfsR/SARP family transcriptional regulator [Pseudomonadota bacterium]